MKQFKSATQKSRNIRPSYWNRCYAQNAPCWLSAKQSNFFVQWEKRISGQDFIRNNTQRPESVLSLVMTHTHTRTRNHTRSIRHILLPCVENEAEGSGPAESWLAVQRRRRQDSGAIYHTTAHSTKTQREARAIYIVHLRRRQMNCSFMAYPAESERGDHAGGL